MEQNKKNEEVPAWVKEVENLIPSARQTVGTLAANSIQNLGLLYEVSPALYRAVITAVVTEVSNKFKDDSES